MAVVFDISRRESPLNRFVVAKKNRKNICEMASPKVWSENHTKLTSFLEKLYPTWSDVLSAIDDEAILDEVILLLAYYFDCEAPCLFVHPISEIGQVQLDCAKVNLGAQAGDMPLVINVYRKFCATPKRERHHWCAQHCVDYATVKKLDQAYSDLKCSTEGHIGCRIIGNNNKSLMEKLYHLGQLTLKTSPETVYLHDGMPGLSYLNVKSLERIRLTTDATLSLCPVPPKYILVMPNTRNLCTLTCDEADVKSTADRNRSFELLLSRAVSKIVICTKICDCGTGFRDFICEDSYRRLKVLTNEVWKHCGCEEAEVHVTPDPITQSLMLFCPESFIGKVTAVVEERVKIIKAECEANFTDVDFPESSDVTGCVTAGGHLAETKSQPGYDRTLVFWVNSPKNRRKLMDEDLSEEYIKDTLLKSVKDVIAVRKFRDYPESAMWGLVIMKDTMACKDATRDFNRLGGKYRLQWINNVMSEIVLMFSVEKKLKNKVWVKFTTEQAFETAKRFPWNEYWVVETYFFDDRQAKFVFRRDRNDIYRLRNDIADLANVSVASVKHETISPLRWPEEDLNHVEDTLETKFKDMSYLESYDIQFLSRKQDDTQWQGVVRFESYHKHAPDKFHRDTGSVLLTNDMVFINNGVRDGLTMKIPRKVYYLLKKEIQEQETDFHGSVGVQISNPDDEIVSVHFIWWNGGKMPDKLYNLMDLLKPVYILGADRGLGEILRNDHRPFKVIERWFQVAIVSAEESSRIIMIYGRQNERKKARDHLKSLHVSDSTKENTCYEIIPLSGPTVPSGLITTMINKYGYTLDRLQIISGCSITHLDKQRHAILCRGRPSDIQLVKEELDTCCSELAGNTWACLFTQVRECVACLCPIDNPRNPAYHLDVCGHPYCTECLISQIKTQMSQKLLPITCVAGECEAKFNIDDILAACNKGDESTAKFVEVALQHHLSRNKPICKPCPTPDCPMMFHIPVDDDKRFDCPHCNTETCIGCQEKWHAGFSCEIKKEIDNLEDKKLKTWILKRPKFRKMCPCCKSGVEKMGGCDNVHCSSCATSMCWKCLAFFKTSGECYDHIATKHRNEPADYDYDDELVDNEED